MSQIVSRKGSLSQTRTGLFCLRGRCSIGYKIDPITTTKSVTSELIGFIIDRCHPISARCVRHRPVDPTPDYPKTISIASTDLFT